MEGDLPGSSNLQLVPPARQQLSERMPSSLFNGRFDCEMHRFLLVRDIFLYILQLALPSQRTLPGGTGIAALI